jgi:hypothetical protein
MTKSEFNILQPGFSRHFYLRLAIPRIFSIVIAAFFTVIGITKSVTFGSPYPNITQHKVDFQFPDTLADTVYNTDIHTVLLKNADWEFSIPVLEAGSEQKLELRFDDLSNQMRRFGYTLIHCDVQWIQSSLAPQVYLSGFGQGIIRETYSAFNTTYTYLHYRLIFPEADCMPVISGNYALVVFDEEDPDEILFIRRFYVTEKTVEIEATIKQPSYGQDKETGQQVVFSVLHNENEIRDPVQEVIAVIQQNNRSDNMIYMSRPYSVQQGKIEYTHPDEGIFHGGNEFRSLDIKSMRYQTENIALIDFQNPYYHVYMKPDEDRADKPYFSRRDLNGGYYIDMEKAVERHIDADYVFVHFKLSLPVGYADDKIFVTGSFTDWTRNCNNRMKYNEETGDFELTLLLKQGLYDYCFMKSDLLGMINEYDLEGSYYETENDYSIFVYFHDRHKGYDRLIGFLPIK